MDRGGDLRCGKHRLQLRDLGGRGPGDAGLPPARLFIAHFPIEQPGRFRRSRRRIERDPRLTLEAKRETRYYLDQSEMMAKFLRILGLSLTVIFSIGAIIGAMITMYSAVANRIGEIGTMRALGFQRRSILAAFLLGVARFWAHRRLVGLFFASFMQFITVSTVNFQTFSELAFKFTLTGRIAAGHGIFPRHGPHRRDAAGAARLADEDRRGPADNMRNLHLPQMIARDAKRVERCSLCERSFHAQADMNGIISTGGQAEGAVALSFPFGLAVKMRADKPLCSRLSGVRRFSSASQRARATP